MELLGQQGNNNKQVSRYVWRFGTQTAAAGLLVDGVSTQYSIILLNTDEYDGTSLDNLVEL